MLLEFWRLNAGVAQLVEHQPSKLRVAGSSLVARSIFGKPLLGPFVENWQANVAQG